MKKLLSILTLGVLLFSSITPSFTYAVDIEEVSSLLESFLQSTNNEQQENNENIFQQNNNHLLQTLEDETWEDEIELIWNDPHIIWNKTKWEITVYTWDFSYGITLEDKNLWAQNVWETGLYYQWWNNHGNPSNSAYTSERLEYNTNWDNNWYSWEETKFIGFNYYPNNWDIRELIDNNWVSYPNLRWWWNDNTDYWDNWNINLWYDKNTHKATNIDWRKWPCNYWYHIPSAWEWSELIRIYAWIKNLETSINTYNWSMKLIFSRNWNFKDDLKLIYWWLRDYNTTNGMAYYWDSWLYRSSTPVLTQSTHDYYSYATYIWKNINSVENISTYNTYQRANWQSIRCFKNEYVPYELKVKFNPNWWAFSWMDVNVIKTYEYQTNENWIIPIYNIQIPNRESEDVSQQSWWMFAWWYTKSWEIANNIPDWWEEFDISNPQSTTAYAKWLPFNDLKLNLWWREIIIMDRNLWAEEIAEWVHKSENNNQPEENNKLWFYYQWWNNYWFNNNWNIANSWTDLISNPDHENNPWWPWNYYYNNKFIKRRTTEPYRWDNESNKNLRWWEYQKNSDNDRQWPCPNWYHVPELNEWFSLKAMFHNEYNNTNFCDWIASDENKCFAKKIKLPFAWYRDSSYSDINDKWRDIRYRTSTRWDKTEYWEEQWAYSIFMPNSWITTLHTYRITGASVRCFKNSEYENILSIDKDNWDDEIKIPLRWRESINNEYQPDDPINEWYNFLWWYSWDNEFKFNWVRYYKDVSIKAKREKRPRYTYYSNWWLFENWEEEKIIKYQETEFERKVSHTSNVNDDWTINWKYPWNINTIDVVTIDWADILEIKITWGTKCENWNCDYIIVRKWNHPDYDASNYNENDNDFLWKIYWWQSINYRFHNENSYTIWFYSTGNKIYWGDLWYYAEIIWLKYTTDESNIIPIKTWYTFSWRYETWATDPFDFTWTRITQDRTFYAKWIPNTYTIKFNTNWWTWTVENINVTYWEEIQLPTVSKEGYTLKWWKSEDWTIYNNIIPEWTWVTTEDWVTVTLTAQWELIPIITPSAWGGQSITPTKQETKVTEQEHNSADTEDQKTTNTQTNTQTSNVTTSEEIKQQVKKVEDRSLTRWEVAIMTNILLEVYPQLVEWKQELDDVTNACSNYADEQNFTKDEKKAITRLCKLSIMWIHNDTNEPLEEFLVNSKSTNNEFSKVINRSIETYNEKDLSTIKEALKKLEWDEENVVFGTVYDMFMSIKNIFN